MVRKTSIDDRPSRYDQLLEQRAKRRFAIQKMQDTAAATRSAMVAHINNVARGQVQLAEQMVRSRARINKRV